jgi:hypothetical protein
VGKHKVFAFGHIPQVQDLSVVVSSMVVMLYAEIAKERQRLGMPPAEPTIGLGGSGGPDSGKRKRKDGEQRKLTPEEQYQVGGELSLPAAICNAKGCVLTSSLCSTGYATCFEEPACNVVTSSLQLALAMADPSEPKYCHCQRISFGEMIACENPGVLTGRSSCM